MAVTGRSDGVRHRIKALTATGDAGINNGLKKLTHQLTETVNTETSTDESKDLSKTVDKRQKRCTDLHERSTA